MIRSGLFCFRAALLFSAIALLTFAQAKAFGQTGSNRPSEFTGSERLEKLSRDAVAEAVEQFGKGGLTPDKIAVTIIDLSDRARPQWASHRGQELIYPASVVKLFYLVAAHHQLGDRRAQTDRRA